jgi:divalent metal cation (Fe/Co/Zn/Cd) transporter
VAVSGGIILATHGLYWLDAAVALVIAVVVGYHALKLIREVVADLSGRTRREPGEASV